jgi:deoxycytidylate deaminase
MMPTLPNSLSHPELIFGLVGPLGSDLKFVASTLTECLADVDYHSTTVRLSKLMRSLPREPWSNLTDGRADETLNAHMTAGNTLRQILGRGDALAMMAIGAIRDFRDDETGEDHKPNHQKAFILNSLKHPAEVESLRRIYGPAFFLLAAYSPRGQRVQNIAKRIADSDYNNQTTKYLPEAENLLQRDESEAGQKFGQNVQKAFPLADVIINTSDQEATRSSIRRFIELLFGNSFHTPNRDEQGMFQASAAALRSSSLARQVGAAICRPDGGIVAGGTNDVAKAGGGLYWDGDNGDARDFRGSHDTSSKMRENLLADILQKLRLKNWLRAEMDSHTIPQLVESALRSEDPFMKGAHFMSSIDYIRAVHAEMDAIMDCARNGISTAGTTLYTTTFPCHDCAKHIVASGICRVVYVEPYPKSLVQELYADSVAVDASVRSKDRVHFDPFVGVAPKRYTEFFRAARPRKDEQGLVTVWQRSNAAPNLPDYLPSAEIRLAAETAEFTRFMKKVEEMELTTTRTISTDDTKSKEQL